MTLILKASFSATDMTYVEHVKCLLSLEVPDGHRTGHTWVTRAPIHLARQKVAETALELGAEWLFMADDDMVFPPDTLKRLMARGGDHVSALAYGRKPPYGIKAYREDPDHSTRGIPLEGVEHTGLRQVFATGLAVSLTRVTTFSLLKRLGIDRWFDFVNGEGEDFYFSRALRDNGLKQWVDTDLIVGHLGDAAVVDEAFVRRQRGVESARRSSRL